MKISSKKTILIDLDGVLNEYTGQFDENFILHIKDGALDFIRNLSADYKVKIFTSRNLLLASEWVIKNELAEYIDDVTNIKTPCYLFVDDRCIKFNGNYKELRTQIDSFNVWFKQYNS